MLPLAVTARIVALGVGAVLRGVSVAAAIVGLALVAPAIVCRGAFVGDPHGGAFMTLAGLVLFLVAVALWTVGTLLWLAAHQPTSRPPG